MRPKQTRLAFAGGFFVVQTMPNLARRPCSHPGCSALTQGKYCSKHAAAHRKLDEVKRASSTERGYGYKWQKLSKAYLRDHPICECDDCKERPQLLPAHVVDHIIPHRLKQALDSGDPDRIAKAQKLFWSQKNWQAMNKQCHDRKTAREDGGFGRPARGGGQKSGEIFF